jgi:hypothetical protein
MIEHNDIKKQCAKCQQAKNFEEFQVDNSRKDGRQPYCKKCKGQLNKKHVHENKEHYQAWRRKHKSQKSQYDKEYRELNLTKIKEDKKIRLLNLKIEVFTAYGGVKCSCCQEPEISFLAIDHIHGGGTQHRKKTGMHGQKLYRWLKINNYPSGYRVLCHNCNWGIHVNSGVCPHKKL